MFLGNRAHLHGEWPWVNKSKCEKAKSVTTGKYFLRPCTIEKKGRGIERDTF